MSWLHSLYQNQTDQKLSQLWLD